MSSVPTGQKPKQKKTPPESLSNRMRDSNLGEGNLVPTVFRHSFARELSPFTTTPAAAVPEPQCINVGSKVDKNQFRKSFY